MNIYTYEFECIVLAKKILLKASKKAGVKSCFKEGFEFQGKYYICLEKCLHIKKNHYYNYKCLVIESAKGGLWRIPILKRGPENGLKWWPDNSQVPNKEAVKVLKELYAFLKA